MRSGDRALLGRDRANQLFDAYGALLTPRQQDLLRRYYQEDLSLGEIAEQTRVSRQAVHDALRRATTSLDRFEAALGLVGGARRADHYFTRTPRSPERFRIIRDTLRGRPRAFRVASGVFAGRGIDAGTRLLIDAMQIGSSDRVLDLGCGYGAVGLTAAALAEKGRVWMIDTNERAATLARANAADHGLANVHVLIGDGAAAIGSACMDVVVTNPPIRAGRRTVEAFVDDAWRVLRPGGRFYLVARTAQGAKTIARLIGARFGAVTQVRAASGYRVYEACRAPASRLVAPQEAS